MNAGILRAYLNAKVTSRKGSPESSSLHCLITFLAAIALTYRLFFVSGFNAFRRIQFPIPQDNPPVQPAGYAFRSGTNLCLGWIAAWLRGLVEARDRTISWHGHALPLALFAVCGVLLVWRVAVASPVWASVADLG